MNGGKLVSSVELELLMMTPLSGAIGAIAAATVMGVYGSDAVKMKNEINRLNDLMQADEQELQDDLNIVGALSNLQASMLRNHRIPLLN